MCTREIDHSIKAKLIQCRLLPIPYAHTHTHARTRTHIYIYIHIHDRALQCAHISLELTIQLTITKVRGIEGIERRIKQVDISFLCTAHSDTVHGTHEW